MRLQQRDAPEICLLSKEKILFLSNVCQGRCTQRPQNAFEFEFLIGRRRETLLFHGLSAEGAKASVVDTQTPDDPSFICFRYICFKGFISFKTLYWFM